MSHEAVAALVQEMRDLLDAGPVGLYEFAWWLNSAHAAMPPAERESVARQALDRMLAEPGTDLIWCHWPDTTLGPADRSDLGPDPFADIPPDGRYLALDRPEPLPSAIEGTDT
jgi:hypothetical protein